MKAIPSFLGAGKNKLKILFVQTTNSGVAYWRLYNYSLAAWRNGIADSHVLWWQKNLTSCHPWEIEISDPQYTWRITKEMQDWVLQSDAIVFQMLHTKSALAAFRAIKDMCPGKTIISEIDDHMLSTPIYNPADEFYAPQTELRALALSQFKESDGMVVSTPYLKEVYSEVNENIHVVPNCIDFTLWDKAKPNPKPGIRIGWAGGATHTEDLALISGVIDNIGQRFPEIRFVFVHGLPEALRGKPNIVHVKKWTPILKYPKFIAGQDFDIGIAPLVDNAFNRGKSNIRWLECAALKVPVVASNVGHFKETINSGKDGFLADNPAEFEEMLVSLIKDRQKRVAMGLAAYERARRDFNVDTITEEYAAFLAQCVEKKAHQAQEVMA